MSWQLVFTRQAQKDARKLSAAGLKPKAQELLAMLATNPYQNPPPYEKLVGDLSGAYSRRINIQHRLVYQVLRIRRWSKSYVCGRIRQFLEKIIPLSRWRERVGERVEIRVMATLYPLSLAPLKGARRFVGILFLANRLTNDLSVGRQSFMP